MSEATEELLGRTGVRWSAESVHKAEQLISDKKVQHDPEAEQVYWVEGSQRYRVQTDGKTWLTCTCPNGQRTSRPTCYHSGAVLMMIAEKRDVKKRPRCEDCGSQRLRYMIPLDFEGFEVCKDCGHVQAERFDA
jgi:hypothetical protein